MTDACPACGAPVPKTYISDLEVELSEEAGRKVRFTRLEADLLEYLRSGRLITKNFLIENLWFPDEPQGAWKALDVHVCHIRKKLKGTSYRIDTVWGVGFRWVHHE